MAHFLSEGTALGALGLAVDERGQGGVSIPAPIAQGIDSSPPALVSPTTTMEPRPPPLPPPPPAGLRKPSLIGSRTLGSLFFTGSSQE